MRDPFFLAVVGARGRAGGEGGRATTYIYICIHIYMLFCMHRFLTAYDFPGNLEELEMLVTDALNKVR